MAIAISIMALMVSILSAFAFWASARAAVLGHFFSLERSLSELPSALRFHGISERDLEEAGVTAPEFAYLLANSTVGNFYHRLHDPLAKGAFPAGHYRYVLCQTADFRRAWPLIRRMMTPSNFVRRIDATIRAIEASHASPAG